MTENLEYARCRDLQARLKKHYLIRIILTIGLLVLDIYVQTVVFLQKYPSDSFETVAQGEGTLNMMAFGMGTGLLILSIITAVLGFFASYKHRLLTVFLMAMTLVGTVFGFYHWLVGVMLLLLFGHSLYDAHRYQWLIQQPGYPHFSERLDEQELHREYVPVHQIKDPGSSAMTDTEGNATAQQPVTVRKQEITEDPALAASFGLTDAYKEAPELGQPDLPPQSVTVSEMDAVQTHVPAPSAPLPPASPELSAEDMLSAPAQEELSVRPEMERRPIPAPEAPPAPKFVLPSFRNKSEEDTSSPVEPAHYQKCRNIMKRCERAGNLRFWVTFFCMLINAVGWFMASYLDASLFVSSSSFEDAPNYLIFTLAALVLGAFICMLAAQSVSEMDDPRWLWGLLGLLGFSMLIRVVFTAWLFLFLVWGSQFFDVRSMKWVKAQEGYPRFNVRFQEQERAAVYHSTYKLDGISQAEMPDTDAADIRRDPGAEYDAEEAIARMRQRLERRRVHTSGEMTEMLDAANEAITELQQNMAHQQALSAAGEGFCIHGEAGEGVMPEIVLAEDMPAQTAPPAGQEPSVPEPLFPDPVMPERAVPDIPDPAAPLTSDFPEIAGDIPDLPEIPDIPQL